jgi:hypothetical protein
MFGLQGRGHGRSELEPIPGTCAALAGKVYIIINMRSILMRERCLILETNILLLPEICDAATLQ